MRVSIGDPGCGRYALAVADVTRRPVAGVARRSTDGRRRASDQQRRRRHQLRDARARASDARVRRREARRRRDSRAPRARRARRSRRSTARPRTLDETMLVIADHEHAVAIAGVMGGAPIGSLGQQRRGLRSRARGSSRPRSARRASKLGLKTEASARFERGADLDAPVRALARVRCSCSCKSRRGHARPAASPTCIPRPVDREHRSRCGVRASRVCSVRPVPDAGRSSASSAALGFEPIGRRRRAGRWTCRRSASTSCAKPTSSRKSAGTGASIGFRRRSRRCASAAARRRRPASTRAAPAAAALRRGPAGSGDVHVHRAAAGRPRSRPDALVPIANPLSEKFAVAAAVAAAGPGRLARLQPAAGSRERRGSSRSGAVFSPAGGEQHGSAG